MIRALILALLLVGCAGNERIEGSGVIAEPPYGWIDYCVRHPEEPLCNGAAERKS